MENKILCTARHLGGVVPWRAVALAIFLLAPPAAMSSARADVSFSADWWKVRVCYRGDAFGIWVTFGYDATTDNYDPVTHVGTINYSTNGPFDPNDFFFNDVPDGAGSLVSFQGGQTSMMGSYSVLGGLGTGTCTVAFPSMWLEAGDWSFHLITNAAFPVMADLPLTGFTAGGEGIYYISGLNIPVQFEIFRPDGTSTIVSSVVTDLELRTPHDLSPPPCVADLNGDGILDLDDINIFVQGFLGGCP